MAQNDKRVWPAIAIACVLVVILNALVVMYAVPKDNADLDLSPVLDKMAVTDAKVDSLIATNTADTEKEAFVVTKTEFEKDSVEEKALELAEESVMSRDFKKAVFELLSDVDSYKDITEVKIKDTDVSCRRDTCKIDFEVKVYYFTDGDEDETERALLKDFEVVVNDVVFEDDFEDAEVNEDYFDDLTVDKIYE